MNTNITNKLIKIAVKNNVTKFTFKIRQGLNGNSFFRELILFSCCPWKERKCKNILVSFRYNKLKVMASSFSPFFIWNQMVLPFSSYETMVHFKQSGILVHMSSYCFKCVPRSLIDRNFSRAAFLCRAALSFWQCKSHATTGTLELWTRKSRVRSFFPRLYLYQMRFHQCVRPTHFVVKRYSQIRVRIHFCQNLSQNTYSCFGESLSSL